MTDPLRDAVRRYEARKHDQEPPPPDGIDPVTGKPLLGAGSGEGGPRGGAAPARRPSFDDWLRAARFGTTAEEEQDARESTVGPVVNQL